MNLAITNTLNRTIIKSKTLDLAIGCGAFVVLMVLGAYVRIPLLFTPVPITLQTFFVLLAGAMLGRRWGALSQMGYIFLGFLGLPVFQGYGAGPAHILGSTGGYIVGFMPAAYLVGCLLNEDKEAGIFRVLMSMALGLAVIYAFGITRLKLILNIDLSTALVLGLYPFLPGAAVKLIAASSIYMSLRRR